MKRSTSSVTLSSQPKRPALETQRIIQQPHQPVMAQQVPLLPTDGETKERIHLSDADIFGIQDRLEKKKNPFPPCNTWTLRPSDAIFGDADDSMGLGHFYSFFHALLNLPPINIEKDEELERAAKSPFERIEVWQMGGRVDLVYVIKEKGRDERKFRIFVAGKKLTRPTPQFPLTTGEKNFPMISDEDRMNFDVLCLFALSKIKEAQKNR